MTLLGAFLASAVVSALVISVLLRTRLGGRMLDVPNDRSLHHAPTPRLGGIGICVAVILVIGFTPLADIEFLELFVFIAAGAMIVMLVSLVDDVVPVNVGVRLLFHFGAAALIGSELIVRDLQIAGVSIHLPGVVAAIFTLLYVMWLINLYNFMDGMDGFAGGMTVVGFTGLSLMTASAGLFDVAIIAVCLAGAAAGFLLFNFPPARVFMGDTGSSTLGFFAGALSLWADAVGAVPLWMSVLLFSPFIVDASVTLVRRAWKRERIWRAHRSHYYQKLVQLGWGHRKTVLAEYALMIACAASAVAAGYLEPGGQVALIILWIIVYTWLIAFVHRLEARQGADELSKTA